MHATTTGLGDDKHYGEILKKKERNLHLILGHT